MGLRALLINGLFAICVPLSLRFPIVALICYYWITFMAPHRLQWGGPDIAWAKVFALCALVSWLASKEKKEFPVNGVVVMLGIFVAWTLFTCLFARFPEAMRNELVEYSKELIMAAMTICIVTTRARLHVLIWVIVISVGFYALKGGGFVILSQGNWKVIGLEGAIVGQTNESARAFMYTIPLMFFLYLHSKVKIVRWGLLAAIGLTVLALIGTNSRGGFLSFGAACFVFWLYSRRKALWIVTGLTLAAVGFVALPKERVSGWLERIESTAELEGAQGRFSYWENARAVAADSFTGYGFGAFHANIRVKRGRVEARNWHSNYFQVMADHGYLGLVLYMLLALTVLISAGSISRRCRRDPELYWIRDLSRLLQAMCFGYLVGGVVINHAYWEPYYVLIAFLVALDGMSKKRLIETGHLRARGRRARAWQASPVGATSVSSRTRTLPSG